MYEFLISLVELVKAMGYTGLFIMTFVESTFVPIPSEVTVIPAGYLVSEGEMSFVVTYLTTIFGTVAGSLFNYWIARKFGRSLLIKYGKYFFITDEKLKSIELFFKRHGIFSTFSGRLLPGIKHFISFPAGIGKMNLRLFISFTAFGGAIWNGILLGVGYFIGRNEDIVKKYIFQINILIVLSLFAIAWAYYRRSSKPR